MKKRRLINTIIILIAIIAIGFGGFFYYKLHKLQNNSNQNQSKEKEVDLLLSKVSDLYLLPEGERPTIATVSDPLLIKNQNFFTTSEAGDKVQNIVVLGAAASHLPFAGELIEHQLHRLFGRKGERIVKANINAFRMGDAASRFAAALAAAGVTSPVIARLLPRIAFEPEAVPEQSVAAWCQRLLREDAAALAQQIFEANEALAPDAVPA